jgi:hypothetical protein
MDSGHWNVAGHNLQPTPLRSLSHEKIQPDKGKTTRDKIWIESLTIKNKSETHTTYFVIFIYQK